MARASSLTTLRRLLRPRLGLITGALVLAWAATITDLVQPMLLKLVFDNALKSKAPQGWLSAFVLAHWGGDARSLIVFAAAGALVVAGVGAICTYYQKIFSTSASQWVTHDLRGLVYARIQRLALAFHDRARTGDLLTRTTGDIDAIQTFVTSGMMDAITALLRLAGMVAVMLTIDWRFTLISLSVAPVLGFIAVRYARRVRKSAREVRRKEGEIASRIQETFASIRVVKAFAQEESEGRRLEEESLETIDLAMRVRRMKARLGPMVDIVVAVGTSLVLWYGARRVLNEELSVGTLYLFMQYLTKMYKPIQDLSKLSDQYSKAVASYERVREVMDVDDAVQDRPGAKTAPRFTGDVTFERVTLSYHAARPALRDVTCEMRAGQLTAIVGPTGAGKSSLASLILRFYDPDTGAVRIDGHDIREFTQRSLRDQISFVAQDTVLFRAPIWQNIAYGLPGASRNAIVRAAELANAAEFIDRMPEGYDTIVGERGVTLSGGQRQRIAIARAVIRDTPILILDEPSSGLDAASEQLVFEALERLMAGRTSIVIAHRLSTVRRADVILALQDGTIVERGTHAALRAAGGLYDELCRIQFGAGKSA